MVSVNTIKRFRRIVSASICLVAATFNADSQEISGLVQGYWAKTDDSISYQNQGTGILREDRNGLGIAQSFLKVSLDLTDSLQFESVANYYQDGEKHLGLTQALLLYKPIVNSKYKFRARAGFFYPRMSLENVDDGWLSPYTYTQSAINTWIGEELKIAGIEISVASPGRARRSPWSWELIGATYKANDPLGTIISWRGFAMHDRQSLHNDKLMFARYPTVIDQDLIFHPDYVEPFHELDGRLGYYLGAHLRYFNQTSIRYYFYDNLADPLELNEQRLYAWRTKFHSLALQHKFNGKTRIVSQLMTGSTAMGDSFVYVNFDAWYLMLSHQQDQHRYSIRFDRFIVKEDDAIPADVNSSDGYGLTVAWRYDLNRNWQLGFEQHLNKNTAQSRLSLNEKITDDQYQSKFVIQFRW